MELIRRNVSSILEETRSKLQRYVCTLRKLLTSILSLKFSSKINLLQSWHKPSSNKSHISIPLFQLRPSRHLTLHLRPSEEYSIPGNLTAILSVRISQ